MRRGVIFLFALGLAVPASAQSGPTSRSPALLIHGNYCGPGNNAPLPPIDALDAACARHDACTPDGSLPPPACNARLQRDAEAISRDPRQPEALRTAAGAVAMAATLMPSLGQGETLRSMGTVAESDVVAYRHAQNVRSLRRKVASE